MADLIKSNIIKVCILDVYVPDLTLLVNIGMVDFGFNQHLWRFKRILGGKSELELECALIIGTLK